MFEQRELDVLAARRVAFGQEPVGIDGERLPIVRVGPDLIE
jgi:hypothetical protein